MGTHTGKRRTTEEKERARREGEIVKMKDVDNARIIRRIVRAASYRTYGKNAKSWTRRVRVAKGPDPGPQSANYSTCRACRGHNLTRTGDLYHTHYKKILKLSPMLRIGTYVLLALLISPLLRSPTPCLYLPWLCFTALRNTLASTLLILNCLPFPIQCIGAYQELVSRNQTAYWKQRGTRVEQLNQTSNQALKSSDAHMQRVNKDQGDEQKVNKTKTSIVNGKVKRFNQCKRAKDTFLKLV